MSTTPMNRILSPSQVASYLGIGRTKVYELMHQRDFPGFRIGDRYKVSEVALNEWIARQPYNRGSQNHFQATRDPDTAK